MACQRCGGRLMYDRLDAEWRCLLCGRARRRRAPILELSRPPTAFRRKWDVSPEELRADRAS